jgi:polyphosphate kinase
MLEQRDGQKIDKPVAEQRKVESSPTFQPGAKRKARMAKPRRKKLAPQADKGLQGQTSLDPSLYINRELSWLEFNQRVLEEAHDERHPLLDRVKFLAITSSNLNEFFMIRVAALKEQIAADVVEYSPDGKVPMEQLQAIHRRTQKMLKDKAHMFWHDLHPKLAAAGIHLLRMNQVTNDERKKLADYFAREIFPVLTPLAFDPGHPFPYISNLSLSLALVVVSPKGEERFARVKVPDVLPRLVPIPGDAARQESRFVWLEDLIRENLAMLFPGMAVKESYAFHVTRNADIEIQEDEAEDLIHSIEESIKQRRFGSVVRLKVEETMPQRIIDVLTENLEITQEDVYECKSPLDFAHLMSLLKLPRPELKDTPHHPSLLAVDDETEDIFGVIRRGDLVLHHPYDSFAPVVQFIKAAASDPNVLAIKQTLYRIGKESPLVPLLIQAAESGKQVAVLVELKARFDEENNIIWAKRLERAGIHVVYGLVGLKTHAKLCLVVRKEADGLRRYIHLGTGNYNPDTARIYTDFSVFTCKEDIASDASEVFNFLTGFSQKSEYKKLIVAPLNLRSRIVEMIQREIAHARAGKSAQLQFKLNSLTDTKMIETLYEASKAGVKVDLIVRGICCLRPGVKGVSENIRVRSVVGRFLEHSRVFWFANDGNPELYCSSADLMGRNLDRRVELMFPIEEKVWMEFVKRETLDVGMRDNVGARMLDAHGCYTRLGSTNSEEAFESQRMLIQSRLKKKT